jgi:signal transduction histidine kinase
MEILIRDDGKGFDVRREFGGNGVRGMQHRAGELGWDLRIESSPAGTDIHVLIPLER